MAAAQEWVTDGEREIPVGQLRFDRGCTEGQVRPLDDARVARIAGELRLRAPLAPVAVLVWAAPGN